MKYLSVVIFGIALVQCTALVIKPGTFSKNADHHLSKRQAADTSDVDYSQFKPVQGPTEKPITIVEIPKAPSQPKTFTSQAQHIQEESSVDGREIQNENGFRNSEQYAVTPNYHRHVTWNHEQNFEAKPNRPIGFGAVPTYWNSFDTHNGINTPPVNDAYRRHIEAINRNRFGIPPQNEFGFSTSFNSQRYPPMQNTIRTGFYPNDGYHSEYHYDSNSNGNGNEDLRGYLIRTFSSTNPEIHQIIDRLNI